MNRTSRIVIAFGTILAIGILVGCSTTNTSPATSATSANVSSSASASASASANTEEAMKPIQHTDAEIIDAVLGNFNKLAAIPRQSGNEQQVSDFLKAWAEEHDFNVTQDAANNIIVDIPATKGLEDLPLLGLQAHMDMVCVAAAGVMYDPATDPIVPIRNDAADTLTADGTSLGADDGIGVALIMDICESNTPHGPLRVFFTTNEEAGFTGVKALNPTFVTDLSYLINVDSEEADAVTVSSAGGETLTTFGSLDLVSPTGDTAATITLDGLLGGHSGLQINEGHCNAVTEVASLLRYLSESEFPYELASLEGGTAENAIPSSASATIVYAADKTSTLESLVRTYENTLWDVCGAVETNMSMRLEQTTLPEWAFTYESGSNVLSYVLGIHDGVYTMSEDITDLVESSSNLGILSANTNDGFYALSFARSSDRDRLEEIIQQQLATAAACGFNTETGDYTDAWPYNPNSTLRPLCEKVYKENEGTDIRVEAIHAALECGSFAVKNPRLDIVSLGPTVRNVHSADENVQLSSIPVTWRLLAGVLAEIK